MQEAARRGVPPALADAVAGVESGYDPAALGAAGEIGLMQVLPNTAAALGFRGNLAGLFDPATNLRLGVAYLARAWAASGGNPCRALMKYRAGLGEERYSPLSLAYCARARAWLLRQGSPLASRIPDRPPTSSVLTPVRHLDLAAIAALADLPIRVEPRDGVADAVRAALAE